MVQGGRSTDGAARPRILVVEDEMAIAMLLEDMLDDLGYEAVGPVATLSAALAMIEGERLDGAVMDVNLAGEASYPAAAALAGRGVPFVLATGYGEGGVDGAYRGRPVLQKPFDQDRLAETLTAALAPPQGRRNVRTELSEPSA